MRGRGASRRTRRQQSERSQVQQRPSRQHWASSCCSWLFAGSHLICRALQRLSDAVGDYQKGIASAPCTWDSGRWRQHDTEWLGLMVLPARMASKVTMLERLRWSFDVSQQQATAGAGPIGNLPVPACSLSSGALPGTSLEVWMVPLPKPTSNTHQCSLGCN